MMFGIKLTTGHEFLVESENIEKLLDEIDTAACTTGYFEISTGINRAAYINVDQIVMVYEKK